MSAVDRSTSQIARVLGRTREFRGQATEILFGDRLGFALFLGSLCFAGLYWRIGFFITDNATLANGVVALADGRLWIDEATYRTLNTPGMHVIDERLYARNYGQLALGAILLWVLRALSAVVDVGVLPSALWSLAALGFCVQVGRLLGRYNQFAVGGSLLCGGWFLLNLSVGRPIEPDPLPLMALDVGALLAVSLSVVAFYRLLAHVYDDRVGVAAAVLVVAGTPIAFWATIPKRHVFVVAAVVGVMYALYRSRTPTTADSRLSATGFRALAYAQVGLITWVHAPEGLVLFLALLAVDLPTAPSNDRRSLALVAGVFVVSLLPLFLTNALVSGNPLRVPRMLPRYDPGTGAASILDGSGGSSDPTGRSAPTAESSGTSISPLVAILLDGVLRILEIVVDLFVDGVSDVVRDPGGLYHVFVRGGYIESVSTADNYEAIYLTVLESAPVVAGVTALLTSATRAGLRSIRRPANSGARSSIRRRLRSATSSALGFGRALVGGLDPRHAVDAFVVLVAVGFSLLYLPRLPIHAQVTVRYLLPLYPFGIYALARHAGLRRVLSRHGRLGLWTWGVGVCVGVQLLFVAIVSLGFGRGEAFQLHAVLALVLAAPLSVLAASSPLLDRFDRLTAVAFGLATALVTNFLLLSGVVYFQYGQYALPAVDALATLLSLD